MQDISAEIAIVGAGIVGLSTGMNLLEVMPGFRIVVLEKEPAIARHQTGHNSGVIHSGIYYRPGSLKAKNCVSGAAKMVEFCRDHNLPYEVCGKVVVATSELEMPGLLELLRRGTENGVPGLRMLTREELRDFEPHCKGVAALLVPGTGITDYTKVAEKYKQIITENGGQVLTGCEVQAIVKSADHWVLSTASLELRAKFVINCAGLHSDRIMRMAGEVPPIRIVPFRGEYYELRPERSSLVRNLIYPVADPRFPFLGVHFTRRIGGGVEAGPNAVLALKREGYRKTDVSLKDTLETITEPGFWKMASRYWASGLGEYYRSLSKAAFVKGLQKLVPAVRGTDLHPGGSGVRAQALDHAGKLLDDFAFFTTKNMIHVCNVPSPAATASLVIGEQISQMAIDHFGFATKVIRAPTPS